jgi:predicted nucleic acid-binding protein
MPAEVLTNLPPGSEVLIDANIFVYAFLEISRQCVEFLRRCSVEDVLAVTTADVVSDVCHRLMLAEAVATGAVPRQSAPLLKRKPDIVRALSRYWLLTAGTFQLPILVLELDDTRVRQAHEMIERHACSRGILSYLRQPTSVASKLWPASTATLTTLAG